MLFIEKKIIRKIRSHAIKEVPKEACGILAGIKNDGYRIFEAFSCRNVDSKPNSAYTIEPEELLRVLSKIEVLKGIELIGFYHSHPFTSPFPSETDRERAMWDGFIYLIYSLPQDRLKGWKWKGETEKFIEEKTSIL
jgi:proteasome lid subunit RPN8/RPN11